MKNASFRRKKKDSSIDVKKLPVIRGFSLDKNIKAKDLLSHYRNIGFQASHIGKAAEIIESIKKEKAEIYLACTSNIVSSGLRELIAQLCEKKLVAGIITSTGAIEEDF